MYSATRIRHPKEAEEVEVFVNEQYEKALKKILYTIGNMLRHHAKLTNADHIQNRAFMDHFIEDYGYQYFRNGVSFDIKPRLEQQTVNSKLILGF